MNQPSTSTTTPTNGGSTVHDLFALTDEQILEIEPDAEPRGPAPAVISSEARNLSSSDATDQALGSKRDSWVASLPRNDGSQAGSLGATSTSHESPVTSHGSTEPPAWLATQMKDPWNGEEAKELWNGVQQARQEAAAYRAAFATPEDARALKELYPGGVNEARAAANRARLLDQIDGAYFGAAGKSAEETSAARAQLAQMMLREDPAAFREMVFAGLRALEETNVAVAFRPPSEGATTAKGQDGHLKVAAASPSTASAHDAQVATYAAFEKATNEDLERSVGAAISRTIEQALPNVTRTANASAVGAQHAAPLQARLNAAIRQDVEAALKGDRQLGEQIAQILSAHRFDNETRAQVVRLIDDRARQLVPSAAKRVLSDWTQTTLAAHRGNASRTDAATARREVAPVNSDSRRASLPAASTAGSRSLQRTDPNRGVARSRAVDYRKLSDEQILDL